VNFQRYALMVNSTGWNLQKRK
jgi:hypothetical protein